MIMRWTLPLLLFPLTLPAQVIKDAPQLSPLQRDSIARAALPAARPADVSSVDAIIAALYDVISGPAGQKRDWDRFRSLFYPGARLIPSVHPPSGKTAALVLSPEDYIARSGPVLEQRGFFEREIGRTIEQFGAITHVFSSYDSRNKAEDPDPFARGINSIQLLNDGRRWWVVTIFWDAERPGTTIPPKYLR
jgi:hypothetical protein